MLSTCLVREGSPYLDIPGITPTLAGPAAFDANRWIIGVSLVSGDTAGHIRSVQGVCRYDTWRISNLNYHRVHYKING